MFLNAVNDIDEITVEDVQDILDNVEGKKPIQRLIAAIASKNALRKLNSPSGTAFSDGLSIAGSRGSTLTSRSSILLLMFIDLEEIGSYQKKVKRVGETVHGSPEEIGVNSLPWMPVLVRQYPDETDDVAYSIPSCRLLLNETGLSYQKPRRTAAESDADEQETFRVELKNGGRWTPQ